MDGPLQALGIVIDAGTYVGQMENLNLLNRILYIREFAMLKHLVMPLILPKLELSI